jgi:acetyl esterase/lipase
VRFAVIAVAAMLLLMSQQPITFDQVASLPARPPDHRIAYGKAPQQFGNLRLPKGEGRHPVVIFIHGGCYSAQYSIDHVAVAEQAIADAGYAVWSFEYRRVGDAGGGWPGTFQDVGAGADYLRMLAKQYPLDLNRVIASGHSAGGNFALWLAGRARIASGSLLHVDAPLPIAGVLALAPAGDLAEMHAKHGCGGVLDQLIGGSPAAFPDRYAAASPALPLGVPQAVIIGAHDSQFASFGRSYARIATSQGDTQLRLLDAPDAGHFDLIAPMTSTWNIVLKALREVVTGIAR